MMLRISVNYFLMKILTLLKLTLILKIREAFGFETLQTISGYSYSSFISSMVLTALVRQVEREPLLTFS